MRDGALVEGQGTSESRCSPLTFDHCLAHGAIAKNFYLVQCHRPVADSVIPSDQGGGVALVWQFPCQSPLEMHQCAGLQMEP